MLCQTVPELVFWVVDEEVISHGFVEINLSIYCKHFCGSLSTRSKHNLIQTLQAPNFSRTCSPSGKSALTTLLTIVYFSSPIIDDVVVVVVFVLLASKVAKCTWRFTKSTYSSSSIAFASSTESASIRISI